MAIEKVIIQYEADLTKLRTQLDETTTKLKGVETAGKESAKNFGNAFNDVDKKIQSFSKQTLTSVASAIGIAFSVDAIIQFGKASIQAFAEAELNARKLEGAIRNIAGEGQGAFDKLISQSEKFQKISIFSDDQIQQSQTALIQFGLTSKEVDELIPKIIDFASATGDDLATATNKMILGIEGQTRGLKLSGIQFKDTGDKAENLAIISQKLNKFLGQTAIAADTESGKLAILKNRIDDNEESFGKFLITLGKTLVSNPAELATKLSEAFSSSEKAAEQGKKNLLIKEKVFQDSLKNLTKDELEKRLIIVAALERNYREAGLVKLASNQKQYLEIIQGRITQNDKAEDALQEKNANRDANIDKELKKRAEASAKDLAERKKFAAEAQNIQAQSNIKLRDEIEKEAKDKTDADNKLFEEGIKSIENDAYQQNLIEKQKTDAVKAASEEKTAIRQAEFDAAQAISDSLGQILSLAAENSAQAAEFNKLIALFNIGIREAEAIANIIALDSTTPLGFIKLIADYAIVAGGIAQAIGVITSLGAAPKPGFATGTESAPGGMAWVGEKGKELMFVPGGSRIFSNDKSEKYKEELTAIHRGQFENLILDKYVLPTLKEASKKQAQEASFAQNIVNSMSNTFNDRNMVKGIKKVAQREDIYYLAKILSQQPNLRKF